ncbi:MAG: hypothetical protein CMP56_04890 [Flavobacteriales bacterium]|nr:hypothetical protein [Flavobacteriales bacterium]
MKYRCILSVLLFSTFLLEAQNVYQKIKLSKAINTRQNEYHPVPNKDGSLLYFVGMDRTSQFGTKIDFTKTRNYGGEDIWVSERINGIYTDAIPLKDLNDNNHQAVTAFYNNSLLVYGIYEEAYKVDASGTGAGLYNGDIFFYHLDNKQLEHLGQPVNDIFFESDAFISDDGQVLLFVTDKEPIEGGYHQKAWAYNESFWGNTDIWLSEKIDDYWSQPINLGVSINTAFSERTPCLSEDKQRLYFSSNGHGGYGEHDVFMSKRLDDNSWTSWSTPINMGSGINGEFNDWGFKLYDNELKAVLASESKLPYKVNSQLSGNGGVREHNLRNGYRVEGKQSGSFDYNCRTDIYYVDMVNSSPVLVIEDMLFDFDKYSIRAENYHLIDRLVEIIKDNKQYSKISIIGHTDNVGTQNYNLELSKKRAKSIYNMLLKKGVNSENLKFDGKGESFPLFDNNWDNNRHKNRRVEIIFN